MSSLAHYQYRPPLGSTGGIPPPPLCEELDDNRLLYVAGAGANLVLQGAVSGGLRRPQREMSRVTPS